MTFFSSRVMGFAVVALTATGIVAVMLMWEPPCCSFPLVAQAVPHGGAHGLQRPVAILHA